MYFKINYEEVSKVGDYIIERSNELEKLYSDINKLCDEISEAYITEDSPITINKFKEYLTKFSYDNSLLKEGGLSLKASSSSYNDQDDKWANKVAQMDLDKGGIHNA